MEKAEGRQSREGDGSALRRKREQGRHRLPTGTHCLVAGQRKIPVRACDLKLMTNSQANSIGGAVLKTTSEDLVEFSDGVHSTLIAARENWDRPDAE